MRRSLPSRRRRACQHIEPSKLVVTARVQRLPVAAAVSTESVLLACDAVVLALAPGHDLVCGVAGSKRRGHYTHRPVDVMEERLVAGTEVVQAGFAIGRGGETVRGAPAVAGEPDVAAAAVAGQRVTLGVAEGLLLRGGDELEHVPLGDVAEQVGWFDEVVAGVEVAVVFEGESSAGFALLCGWLANRWRVRMLVLLVRVRR